MLFFIFPALAPITFSFQSCSLISGALLKGLVAEQWESAMVAFILRRCCLRSLVNVRRQCFPLGALPKSCAEDFERIQRVRDFERIQRVIPPIAFFFFHALNKMLVVWQYVASSYQVLFALIVKMNHVYPAWITLRYWKFQWCNFSSAE